MIHPVYPSAYFREYDTASISYQLVIQHMIQRVCFHRFSFSRCYSHIIWNNVHVPLKEINIVSQSVSVSKCCNAVIRTQITMSGGSDLFNFAKEQLHSYTLDLHLNLYEHILFTHASSYIIYDTPCIPFSACYLIYCNPMYPSQHAI